MCLISMSRAKMHSQRVGQNRTTAFSTRSLEQDARLEAALKSTVVHPSFASKFSATATVLSFFVAVCDPFARFDTAGRSGTSTDLATQLPRLSETTIQPVEAAAIVVITFICVANTHVVWPAASVAGVNADEIRNKTMLLIVDRFCDPWMKLASRVTLPVSILVVFCAFFMHLLCRHRH